MKLHQLPLLYPFIFLVIGILSGYFLQPPAWSILLPAFIGICSLCGLTFYSQNSPSRALSSTKWKSFSIAIIFLTVGLETYTLNKADEPELLTYGNPITAMVQVEEIRSTTAGERLICRIIATYDSTGKTLYTPHNIRALLHVSSMSFIEGDVLVLPFKFQILTPNSNPRQNQYIEALKKENIIVRQFCDFRDIQIVSHTPTIKHRLTHLRDYLTVYIENSRISHKTASFLITILLGNKTFLSSDTRTIFSQAGLAHILALSGLHITIIATLILTILLPLNLICSYKIRILITLLLLWIFTFVTGANYSTVRACIMVTSVFISRMIERKNSALNALLLSAMIIFIVDPLALFNIGMQLSFVSVVGILLFTEHLNPFDRFTHPKYYKTLSPILVCLIATTVTLPLCALYFKSIPLHFLITNLIILPLLPIYLVIAIIHFFLIGIGTGTITMYLLDTGYQLLYNFSKFLSADGAGEIRFHISPQGTCGYLICILIIGILLNSNLNKRLKIMGSSFGLLCIGFICYFYYIPPQPNSITIKNKSNEITIVASINDREHLLPAPMGQCTMLEIAEYNIVIADGNPRISSDFSPIHCDILIIGRNCQWTYKLLSQVYSTDLVVIHSALFSHLREKILEECTLNQTPVYSLADQGPLTVEFTKTFVPEYTL